jgi:hypothetical protein
MLLMCDRAGSLYWCRLARRRMSSKRRAIMRRAIRKPTAAPHSLDDDDAL